MGHLGGFESPEVCLYGVTGLSDLEWTSLTQELLAASERTGVKLGLSDGHHQLELSQIAASLDHWTAVRIRKKNIRSELSRAE